jgi:hypothetical protein
MSDIVLSLVQDKSVTLEVPQGVGYEIVLEWANPDGTPLDGFEGFTFFSQIRTGTREEKGRLIHEFSLAADPHGSKYAIDAAAAETVFYVSDELAAAMPPLESYFFEVKMLLSGNPVHKFVAELRPVADYAVEQ